MTEIPRDLPIVERDAVRMVVRELREETGIVANDQVGAPTFTRTSTFRHRVKRHLQHEVVGPR